MCVGCACVYVGALAYVYSCGDQRYLEAVAFTRKITYLTQLFGQYVPGFCLSLHPPNAGTELTWLLHGCWCFKSSFSHLHNKHIA